VSRGTRSIEVLLDSMATLTEFPPGWHCYLLLCNDASYYCGMTSNLTNRIRDHACGKGSGYTKKNKPAALLWYESHKNRRSATARENQIKNWNHEKKRQLAEGEPPYAKIGKRTRVPLS
jgi:putative endonuclease